MFYTFYYFGQYCQDLMLARQELFHLSIPLSLFCFDYFSKSLKFFAWFKPQIGPTKILLPSLPTLLGFQVCASSPGLLVKVNCC
jgi:hypothetical protein